MVAGDFIGTDPNGSWALPNFEGVVIQNGATDNTIGGTTIGARDVISGNNWEGVHIVGSGTSGNVVAGNYIGVSTSGSALANAESGVGLYAVPAAMSSAGPSPAPGTSSRATIPMAFISPTRGPRAISSQVTISAPTRPARTECLTGTGW